MIKTQLIKSWQIQVKSKLLMCDAKVKSINISLKILKGKEHKEARNSIIREKKGLQSEIKELEDLEEVVNRARYE